MKRYEFKIDIFTYLFVFIVCSCLRIFVWYILWRWDKICSFEVWQLSQKLDSIDRAVSDINYNCQK